MTTGLSRRHALTGVAAAAVGLPVLAACGDDSTAAPGSEESTASDDAADSGSAAAGTALASTADVPVGGGTIFTDEKVVVTQPTEGEFKAFDTTCTHQGCPVTAVTDTIDCLCHGSKYSLEDGSVVGGPAPKPLAVVEIVVEGDSITLA